MVKTQDELDRLKKECDCFTAKLKELDENELKEVIGAGDIRREKTITIQVLLPEGRINSVDLQVYIDGLLDSSLDKTVDCFIEMINIPVKGYNGLKTVVVKLNGISYKQYRVNFDDRTYFEI